MAIYENSRFKGSYVFLDGESEDERMYLSPFRENILEPTIEDYRITYEAGMRIDILAKEYYGSEQLDWIIMDANPRYLTPFEIKIGDTLILPNPERVMNSE